LKSSCTNESEIKKVTFIGLVLNLLLSALKITAGFYGKSQAVIADGVHSISDCVTDIAVIVGSTYWTAPPDETHPHGHRRIETAITVFIGIALAAVGTGIGWNAVTTFMDEDDPPRLIAFFAAVSSIIVKELLYQWTVRKGKKIRSSAVIANAWHHRSDAISSIPASLAVIISIFMPGYNFIDNIGAIIVSIFIVHAAFKISWPALKELTDAGAGEQMCISIENIARSVHGVKDVHKCRTRYLGSGIQVDMHVLVDPLMSVREGHAISDSVKKELLNQVADIIDVVVHLEPFE
jgi:cation diffusion facilitator family transporter